jgi:hypothetical protein
MRHSARGEPAVESIAQNANDEGNHSLLMLERMSHPKIREQIISVLYAQELHHAAAGDNVAEPDEKGQFTFDERGDLVTRHVAYVSKDKATLGRKLTERMEIARTSTPLSQSGDDMPTGSGVGGRENIPRRFEYLGHRMNTPQMSYVEAMKMTLYSAL